VSGSISQNTSSARDPVELAAELVRCRSVTPAEAGSLDIIAEILEGLGFSCHRLTFSDDGTPDVENLFARKGTGSPHFCFAGHVDVVPEGNLKNWSVDPFAGIIDQGQLVGRGACDMKGAIAAFLFALSDFLATHKGDIGSISVMLSGDEEGPAINGTAKILTWLEENDHHLDHCLIGEPTNPHQLGDMVKVGRRGSLNARLMVHGVQGHVAYPGLADNPIPRMMAMLTSVLSHRLDEGTDLFQPSNLELVTIDTGNEAPNVIPAEVSAGFNIRFNTLHTEASLIDWLTSKFDAVCEEMGGSYELHAKASGEAFVIEPCEFTELVSTSIETVTGQKPELSTSGGTSDARFITHHCPVVEFGLIGQSMHKADEHAAIEDIYRLGDIYGNILKGYFAAGKESG
jgi:succinyl-diaminopimelate desuccinylase